MSKEAVAWDAVKAGRADRGPKAYMGRNPEAIREQNRENPAKELNPEEHSRRCGGN